MFVTAVRYVVGSKAQSSWPLYLLG